VVLETGGPVLMPWLPKVGAVVEAWYAGTNGGEADRPGVDRRGQSVRPPADHLPAKRDQLPRQTIDCDPAKPEDFCDVDYDIEGAAVGYKWFDRKGHSPLFAFGHGLSYSTFGYSDLKTSVGGDKLTVSFKVTNTGKVGRQGRAPGLCRAQGRLGLGGAAPPGRLQEGRPGPGRQHQGQRHRRSAPAGDLRLQGQDLDHRRRRLRGVAGRLVARPGAKADVTLAAKTLPVSYDGK
jgi:beta-glucosidase